MGDKLFIVESPAKAKTIQKYLGQGWKVTASVGHIRDLPEKEMGVTPPDHKPHYIVDKNKQKTVNYIKQLANSAESVWLATDDDREGEAIAWHLQQIIGKHDYKRIRFNKITQQGIQKAIKQPGQLDYPYFLAQQGRRVMDRYAGYLVSPALKDKTGLFLTAGRVQTPALRLIVEREREIEQFVSIEHFGVVATTRHNSNIPWSMEWDTSAFIDDDNPYVTDINIAQAIVGNVKQVVIKSVTEKKTNRNPPAPLITSTLQQAANIRHDFDSKSTMRAAQKLYEAGLITYHRTDNPNLSEEAVDELRQYLANHGLTDYIEPTHRMWKAKDGAQEAHEAIRPTDFNRENANTGDNQQDRIYQLIWQTAVCCQLKAAVYDTKKIRLAATSLVPSVDHPVIFYAAGRTLIFDGWLKILSVDPVQEDTKKTAEQSLPTCSEGDIVDLEQIELVTKATKPPPRYTAAKLVKTLEKSGVGRPSTYADILGGLLSREYVSLSKKLFVPTETGKLLIDLMAESFCFADVEFTNQMENKLDELAKGRADYSQLVHDFYSTLSMEIQAFELVEAKTEAIAVIQQASDKTIDCPKCDGKLSRKKGSSGFFWGCSNYPECRHTAQDNRGKPQVTYDCPECEKGQLRRIQGKSGFFWGCSEYRNGCQNVYQDQRGKPQWKK